jgi:hypothetical protein
LNFFVIDYRAMYDESIKNPTEFWSRQAKKFLKWVKIFDEVDGCRLEEGVISWFTGGQLNVSCKPLVIKAMPSEIDFIFYQIIALIAML